MIEEPKLFISLLKDTRILLIFPDIVKKLKIKLLLLNEEENQNLKKIFPTLLDYRILDPKIELSSIINETSNLMLRLVFYSACTAPSLIKNDNLNNNNIKPMSMNELLGLVSSSGASFSSAQFLSLLNTFSNGELSDMLNTLTTYQLKSIVNDFGEDDRKKFLKENFKYDYDMWRIGIL